MIVGGGIMGSWATYLLSQLILNKGIKGNYRVTLVDAGHPIRGSWGETRALHVAMEDDLRIKMNMLNVNEYLKLQNGAAVASDDGIDQQLLLKKVGRIFVGPTNSMRTMYDLLRLNKVPVDFVNENFITNHKNEAVIESLNGIQIRSEENGFSGWSTIYTPVGYVLKADSILEYLKEKTKKLAEILSISESLGSVSILEDQKVFEIDRSTKTLKIKSCYDNEEEHGVTCLKYDKLLITAGPWTNQILGDSVTQPPLPKLPVVVSNEQTQNFFIKTHDPGSSGNTSHYIDMPLVTYSDGGYVKSGGDYWFIVGPTSSDTTNKESKSMKIGFHRQGTLMNNEDFQLPDFENQSHISKKKLLEKLPHIRKEIHKHQSFETDEFILQKAQEMCKERFPFVDTTKVEIIMRCLYQNTPDKEFIVGYLNDENSIILEDKDDIVVACGFNGGGFQMGPMIARLCVKLLLNTNTNKDANLISNMKIENETINVDYNVENIDLKTLLNDMQKRFDPSRPGLWDL